jgi:hypothetical protein
MKNCLNQLVNEYNESVNTLPYDYAVNKYYYTNGGIATTYVDEISVGKVMTAEDVEDMIDAPLHPEPEDIIGKYEVTTSTEKYYLSAQELSTLLRRLIWEIDCFKNIRFGLTHKITNVF